MAKLYFRYGAMNSGKSTTLLQTAHNYEMSGRKVFIMKPATDIKSGQKISSRIGLSRDVDLLITADLNIFDEFQKINQQLITNTGQPAVCLLVDEAQFLTKTQADQLLQVATLHRTPVIAFGIRTDFLTNGFPGSDRLLQIAHTITEMVTICAECGEQKATLNARLHNNVHTFEGNQVEIDIVSDPHGKQDSSEVTYESLCAICYFAAKNQQN